LIIVIPLVEEEKAPGEIGDLKILGDLSSRQEG
jgi:hypothetical protein